MQASGRPRFHDVSISMDASGGVLFKFLPHFNFFSSEEAQRHQLLKVHTMFSVVQGHATFLNAALTDLEKNGANMTLECIYRTLFSVLSANKVKDPNAKLRNVYVCLDNTVASNKNWTVMRGLAILVSLGICEKVKTTFPLLGHTKGDADAVMGTLQVNFYSTQLTYLAFKKN